MESSPCPPSLDGAPTLVTGYSHRDRHDGVQHRHRRRLAPRAPRGAARPGIVVPARDDDDDSRRRVPTRLLLRDASHAARVRRCGRRCHPRAEDARASEQGRSEHGGDQGDGQGRGVHRGHLQEGRENLAGVQDPRALGVLGAARPLHRLRRHPGVLVPLQGHHQGASRGFIELASVLPSSSNRIPRVILLTIPISTQRKPLTGHRRGTLLHPVRHRHRLLHHLLVPGHRQARR